MRQPNSMVSVLIALAGIANSQEFENNLQFGPNISDEGIGMSLQYDRKIHGPVYVGAKYESATEVLILDQYDVANGKYSIEFPISLKLIGRFAYLDISTGLSFSKYIRRGKITNLKECDDGYEIHFSRCTFDQGSIYSIGVPLALGVGLRISHVGIGLEYGFEKDTYKTIGSVKALGIIYY